MKILKLSWKIGLAGLLGFILGAAPLRTSIVQASAQNDGSVHVFIAPLEVTTAKDTRSMNVPGARVAGISCIPKPTEKMPDHAICYIATSLN